MIPLIGADYPKNVIPLINAARRNIEIVVYDWRWYQDQPGHPVQQFNIALVRAAKRGVIVRAIVNTPLLIPILKNVGIQARQLSDKRVLHSKILIIDSMILVIGSHNFTRNAFGSNIETSIIVPLEDSEPRFASFFNNLYGL